MAYRKYITWAESFAEVNKMAKKHAYEMKVTNELFPREDGALWVNWIGLSQENRDKVYKKAYDNEKV